MNQKIKWRNFPILLQTCWPPCFLPPPSLLFSLVLFSLSTKRKTHWILFIRSVLKVELVWLCRPHLSYACRTRSIRIEDQISQLQGVRDTPSSIATRRLTRPQNLICFLSFYFELFFLIIKNKKVMKKKKKRKTDRENQIKLVKQKTEKWRRNPFHSCWKRCVRSSLFSTRVVIWKFIFLAATFYIRGEKIRPKYLTLPIYTQTHRHTHG